ncbi:MAG: holo-ACP synthase [Candidatus Methylomirabilis sp.]
MRILQGVDLVEIDRFREVFSRHPSLARDLFTEEERAYCGSRRNSSLHFAGRFAAKEATLKALGIGITTGIDRAFREVEILRTDSGRPTLNLHGWVAKFSGRLRVRQTTVSISHSADYVVATVILVSGDTDTMS